MQQLAEDIPKPTKFVTQKKESESLKVAEKNWKRKIEIIEVAAKQAIKTLKENSVPYEDLLEGA